MISTVRSADRSFWPTLETPYWYVVWATGRRRPIPVIVLEVTSSGDLLTASLPRTARSSWQPLTFPRQSIKAVYPHGLVRL